MPRMSTTTRMPGFDRATGWLNSPPLGDLRGKVVLADFWTYTCINWLRTLAHVRAWAEKYEDLVVVGVHTPEFPFEADPENVRAAATRLNVGYPIALDPNYAVWDAFANRYWPAVYIAGRDGHIRHRHFGEGGYEECETAIQELLGESEDDGGLVSPPEEGLEAQADWTHLETPETYLGYDRGERLGSAGDLRLNQWALEGNWTVGERASVLEEAGGTIAFRFHARDVHLVLAGSGAFEVRLDGEPPGEAHGLDVDAQGRGTIAEPRLYQLIRRPGEITDATVEIAFEAAGAEAYVFTFG
jgi:hypothetical protein